MGVLAYLPQYVAVVGGIALSVALVIGALPALITGRLVARPGWSATRTRVMVALGALVGVAWGLLIAFVIPAEPSGGFPGGHWGGTGSRVLLAVWLLVLAVMVGSGLRRELRSRHPREAVAGLSASGLAHRAPVPPVDKTKAQSFVGGLRYQATGGKFSGSFNASAPFARLYVGVDRVTVTLNRHVAKVVRPGGDVPLETTLLRDEVRVVEPDFGLFSPGLRFRTIDPTDQRDGLVFSSSNPAKVIELLTAAGFRVAPRS